MEPTIITARRFWLGSFDGENLYFYTALGHVPTLAAALAKQAARPHHHITDVLIEEQDFARYGIVFGGGSLIRSVIDGVILPGGYRGGMVCDDALASIRRAA